jgi:hypothetical protein
MFVNMDNALSQKRTVMMEMHAQETLVTEELVVAEILKSNVMMEILAQLIDVVLPKDVFIFQ